MSTKIDLFLEEMRLGGVMEHPSDKTQRAVKKTENAAVMAKDLSRIALDLANAVQNYDSDGNTINLPKAERERKIIKLQNSLELAMGRIRSRLNTNSKYFNIKKQKSAVEEIKRKGELAFSEEEWEKAYNRKMELSGKAAKKVIPHKDLQNFKNKIVSDIKNKVIHSGESDKEMRKRIVGDINDELSRKNNILPKRNEDELGRDSYKTPYTKAEEDYEDLFIGGSVNKDNTNNISIERFKDLLLDKDVKDIEPGSQDAKEFARDCVRFSRYIKQINFVPSGSPKDVDQLKNALSNSLRGNKHGDDYMVNNRMNNLKSLYDKRDGLIKKFEDIVGDEYIKRDFDELSASNQSKVLKIVKDVEDLEAQISRAEKESAADYRLKAKVAQRGRYETLRGNKTSTKERLISNLSSDELAKKFHSGISAMGINKLENFNKGNSDKILDLKIFPIDGCTNVKDLVGHWRATGVKPAGQIEIVSQSIAGSGRFVFNINGKYYSAPRNHFIRAGEGIARDDSPDKGYTKNLSYVGRPREIAIKQGKVKAEEAGKYDEFRARFSKASVMTESAATDFSHSVSTLKLNGITGRATKKGITVDHNGAKYLIPTDFSTFPKELIPFKKDLEIVFKGKTHGSTDRLNSPNEKYYKAPEPYKVGYRAQFLLKK